VSPMRRLVEVVEDALEESEQLQLGA